MNAWEMPPATHPRQALLPRWAPVGAAALLAFAVGLGVARLTAPEPVDAVALRAEVGEDLRQQIGAEWRAALAVTSERMYSDLYTQLRDDVDASTARAVLLTRSEAGRALGAFARAYEQDRARRQMTLAELLQTVDDQRVRDVADLRANLRTLASATGYELERTQRQLDTITPVVRRVPPGGDE